jgi:NAD(P)-dependent dehydrogenase (short-subunit alcohol dehydrogenase family)
MSSRLKGKVCVITGTGAVRSMGRASDLACAREGPLVVGCDVSVSHTTNKAEIGMTRQLAMEGSEHGIRVNSISPGLIEAGATRDQLEDPEWASHVVGRTLLGQHGRSEEVANVALFLASDATLYMTGADGLVDSGMKVG